MTPTKTAYARGIVSVAAKVTRQTVASDLLVRTVRAMLRQSIRSQAITKSTAARLALGIQAARGAKPNRIAAAKSEFQIPTKRVAAPAR